MHTNGLVIRDIMPGDRPVVLALNNAAVPHVNALEPAQLDWLCAHCDYARVAEMPTASGSTIAGFVLAIRNGTEYWSANYAWFTERYNEFLYLDRVVVAEGARRRGVGAALYADMMQFAAARAPRVTLEVNIEPPNPGSHAFHARMGFAVVGERRYDGGHVAMMARELGAASDEVGATREAPPPFP
jgi:predicted GNAT superfamily acetyltransferase